MRILLPLLVVVGVGCDKPKHAPDAPPAPPDAPAVTVDAAVDASTGQLDAAVDASSGGIDCGALISCPTPAVGKMSICGQLVDLETSQPIATATPQGTCDPQHPAATGPCALQLHVFDAIAFAGDPQTASDLSADQVLVNECGQFRVQNISPAGAQYVALALENATGVTSYRVTGLAMPVTVGKAVTGVPLFALRATTDQTWTTSAGLTGATFADRGVYVAIFLHGQSPVAGVTVKRAGTTFAADDYYFSDTSPATRSTIDPTQAQTGANGSALMLGANGSLTQYSGTGGEASNCKWPSDLGDQITGTAFVQPRLEVRTADPTMPCP